MEMTAFCAARCPELPA
ncbi:hypothetical protein A2U01_0049547, partial [Trifolium medium]|nr:hypothetical protein [Trifolium medium]